MTDSNLTRIARAMDRYLGVSAVYLYSFNEDLSRLNEKSAVAEGLGSAPGDPRTRLFSRLSDINIRPEGNELRVAEPAGRQDGQNLTLDQGLIDATDEMLAQLKKVVLEKPTPGTVIPKDLGTWHALITGSAESFIKRFDSVSLAWDTLIELVRLVNVPDTKTIIVRDMYLSQVVDLRAHLRVLSNELSLIYMSREPVAGVHPEAQLRVNAVLNAGDIRKIDDSDEDVVSYLVRHSFSSKPDDLVDRLRKQLAAFRTENDSSTSLLDEFGPDLDSAQEWLTRRDGSFYRLLDDPPDAQIAKREIEAMVSVGLRLGFAAWFAGCNSESEFHMMRLRCIFATRALLDDQRWSAAEAVAKGGIFLFRLNAGLPPNLPGDDGKARTAMLRVNCWCAQQKQGNAQEQRVSGEVAAWEVDGLASRYRFCQQVLLKQWSEAVESLDDLIARDGEDSGGQISLQEIERWPLLQELRGTSQYESWRSKYEDSVAGH